MQFLHFLKLKKIFFLQIFLTLYFVINLFGGERGLFAYFEKSNYGKELETKALILGNELLEIENKNNLLSEKMNVDYLDQLYREKLKFGKKNEIIIKLTNDN
tara:strand:+ start:312 stop:617 length:306 start_codon:yes stop_codon:yes gene_type:complete